MEPGLVSLEDEACKQEDAAAVTEEQVEADMHDQDLPPANGNEGLQPGSEVGVCTSSEIVTCTTSKQSHAGKETLEGVDGGLPADPELRQRNGSTARNGNIRERHAQYDLQRKASGAPERSGKRPLSANAAASEARGTMANKSGTGARERRPASAGSKLCDGCKKELCAADASLDIVEDEEDWECEGHLKGTKDTATRRSGPTPSPGTKSPGGSYGSAHTHTAVLGDAYRHADAAQHLLTGLDADSPKPTMSRVEAAARMAAVKDLLRSELDELSQAVNKLDSLHADELDISLAEAQSAARRATQAPSSCPLDANPPSMPCSTKFRGFTRSSQHGQARPASATAGSLQSRNRRAIYGSDKRGVEWQLEMSQYERDLRRSAAVYGVQRRSERAGKGGVEPYGEDGVRRLAYARPASATSARQGQGSMFQKERGDRVAPAHAGAEVARSREHQEAVQPAHADTAAGAHDGAPAIGELPQAAGPRAADASMSEEGDGNQLPSNADPLPSNADPLLAEAGEMTGCEPVRVAGEHQREPEAAKTDRADGVGDRSGEEEERGQGAAGRDADAGNGSRASPLDASVGGIGVLMDKAMDAKQRASLFMRHSELFQSRQDSFLERLAVLAASCREGPPASIPLSAATFEAARGADEEALDSDEQVESGSQRQQVDPADILDRVEAGRAQTRASGRAQQLVHSDRDALFQRLRNFKPARPAFGCGAPRPLAVYGHLSRDARVLIHLPSKELNEVPPQIPPQAFGRPKAASPRRGVTFSPLPTKGGKHRFAPMPYCPPAKPGEDRNIYALPRSHRFDQPPPRSPKKSASLRAASASGHASATGGEGHPAAQADASAAGLACDSPQGRRRTAQAGAWDQVYDDLIPQPQQWRVVDSPMMSSALPHTPLRPHSAGPPQRSATRQRPHSALGTSSSSASRRPGAPSSSRALVHESNRIKAAEAASPFPSSTGFRRLR